MSFKPLADRRSDKAFMHYQDTRREFWDRHAGRDRPGQASRYYHQRLTEVYGFLIAPGQRVLELGSGTGDLLASLKPSHGVGVDFSPRAVELARARHPDLVFTCEDVHELHFEESFDVVVLSDLVNDIWDVQEVLDKVAGFCTADTRIVLNFFNKLWQGPLGAARALGFADPLLKQNWLSNQDVTNLLKISGFEVISTTGELLWPIQTPLLGGLLNKILVKIWPFNHLGLTQFMVARPNPARMNLVPENEATVSVIVPARNEAGHIDDILARTPSMGARTELIFVEGNSSDDTYQVIVDAIEDSGKDGISVYQQSGVGKGDAVRLGYEQATGDVLMILDADMTVAPEDLPRFYRALTDGTGEFINGVRLVYPMENEAMQFLNYLGNKFFGVLFSWLLRQPVKDTLCGTKVLTREAYDLIAENRSYFGDFDPFGDFDLLFGAAKLNLKIVDMPIRYREREYGATNIDRWQHGVLLLRMVAFAAKKLRFV